MLLSDEIYDRILFDGAEHIPLATLAPDLLCLTFNGLSKTYRVAGYRSGWLVITGPKKRATGFLQGIQLLASTRRPAFPASMRCRRRCPGRAVDRRAGQRRRGACWRRDAAWEGLVAVCSATGRENAVRLPPARSRGV